eukprot:1559366-Prymnesium_polylepis.2
MYKSWTLSSSSALTLAALKYGGLLPTPSAHLVTLDWLAIPSAPGRAADSRMYVPQRPRERGSLGGHACKGPYVINTEATHLGPMAMPRG